MKTASNRKAFLIYVWARHLIVGIVLAYLICLCIGDSFSVISNFLAAVGMALLIPLLLLEWIHRPNYFDLERQEKTWKISLFIPDTRLHFTFSEHTIKHFFVPFADLMEVQRSQHFFGWHERLVLLVRRKTHLESITISLDFFSKPDRNLIVRSLKESTQT